MASDSAAKPPLEDPRVADSRQRIFAATLSEFAKRGFDGLTIEGVAAEAGVGKSTIYRHWSGKIELVEDTLKSLSAFELDHQPDETDRHIVERVTVYLGGLESLLHRSVWSEVLPALVHAAQRSDQVAAMHRRFGQQRRSVLVSLLADGVKRGEVSDELDLDLLAKSLVAPIFLDRLMQHRRTPEAEISALVRMLIRA